MKIGIITEYFYPTLGGITENIWHLSRDLVRRGHDIRIITGYRRPPPGLDEEISRRIIYVGRSIPTFFNGSCGRVSIGFGMPRKIKEIFASEKFDIVHLHSPLFPTLPALANMYAKAPIVATFHTCTDNTMLYRVVHVELQNLLDRMAGKIAVSSHCADENQCFFNADFDVIPNGVDVDWWSTDVHKIEKFNDGKINILFLGRPDTRNGLGTLIHAFTKIHEHHPNTRLIIVGDGPLGFYFENLVPHKLKDSIIFEGAATDRRPNYMATAHIMCFAPTIASFGITILEGMSAGKAIVASDIPAFRQLVTHEESALLIEPENEAALVNAIERLVVNKSLREGLGTAAAKHVKQYDWKRITKLHLDYYEDILQRTK